MDWVKLSISAVVGLVSLIYQSCMSLHFLNAIVVVQLCGAKSLLMLTRMPLLSCVITMQVALFGSTESGKGDVWVLMAILAGIIGYIAKIYFT